MLPITAAVSKHLIPIYDKPMIYYPLTTLILAGIREVRIVVNPEHLEAYKRLLGNGRDIGIEISYSVQSSPNGLVGGILAAKDHFSGESSAVVLGDNLFYGSRAGTSLSALAVGHSGALLFAKEVINPTEFGVVELSEDRKSVLSLEEKPSAPKSNLAATGLYFYDSSLIDRAHEVRPSTRDELEITSLNLSYLADDLLKVEHLPSSTVWLDTGTFDGLSEASEFVRVVQARQGRIIGSPIEAARVCGFL